MWAAAEGWFWLDRVSATASGGHQQGIEGLRLPAVEVTWSFLVRCVAKQLGLMCFVATNAPVILLRSTSRGR